LIGLVLSGGCTGMSEASDSERTAFLQARQAPLDRGQIPADFAESVVDVISGPAASQISRRELMASMQKISAATYRDAVHCFTHPQQKFDFSVLQLPVLLMTGEHDQLAPLEEIRGIAKRIENEAAEPDVRFEVIADAGHVCNLEAPQRYNTVLQEFLRRVCH